MPPPAPTSYDEIPYGNAPLLATHPDCLATVAFLHGLTTAPIDHCQVLELGCAEGGNLIPMAQTFPGSHFAGIDLSQKQIASGQAVVTTLGLANITLDQRDILSIQPDFGTFDYILCHGVFSWVPPAVQDHILALCRRNLAPGGVAFVSYNTYPGWHQRGLVRDMLSFHLRSFHEPHQRIQHSRDFLDFLGQFLGEADSAYGRVIRQEIDLLRPESDTYLFHEHLEDVNQPLYFHEFARRAAGHGLQFLAEALPDVMATRLQPQVRAIVAQLSANPVHQQQYLDFLVGRTFRCTLLCHQELAVTRTIDPARLATLHLVSNAWPVSDQPDVDTSTSEDFRSQRGVKISTNQPLLKAALVSLFEVWPAALSFGELFQAVRDRSRPVGGGVMPEGDAEVRAYLTRVLLQCYQADLVELHRFPPRFTRAVSDRPLASPIARLQAGMESPWVTNLRHHSVELTPFDRLLLQLLDGSRDRTALVQELVQRAQQDLFTVEREGQPLRDRALLQETLSDLVQARLHHLAQRALLLS